jgi:hypothetical protein
MRFGIAGTFSKHYGQHYARGRDPQSISGDVSQGLVEFWAHKTSIISILALLPESLRALRYIIRISLRLLALGTVQ